MPTFPGALEFIPPSANLTELSTAVQGCRGCDLFHDAEHAVFGDGSGDASMMLVGEQPGDREDRAGTPFVGPAGRLLDTALEAAQISRNRVYVTNSVKHFRFTRAVGSKRRIHKTPSRAEVVACRPWLLTEMSLVRPEVVVLLGATAAKSLLGNDFRLTVRRGERLRLPPGTDVDEGVDPALVATVHPSSVLRGPPEQREAAFDGLVSDLRFAVGLLPHRG